MPALAHRLPAVGEEGGSEAGELALVVGREQGPAGVCGLRGRHHGLHDRRAKAGGPARPATEAGKSGAGCGVRGCARERAGGAGGPQAAGPARESDQTRRVSRASVSPRSTAWDEGAGLEPSGRPAAGEGQAGGDVRRLQAQPPQCAAACAQEDAPSVAGGGGGDGGGEVEAHCEGSAGGRRRRPKRRRVLLAL